MKNISIIKGEESSVSGNTMRLGNQEDGYFNLKKM